MVEGDTQVDPDARLGSAFWNRSDDGALVFLTDDDVSLFVVFRSEVAGTEVVSVCCLVEDLR